jgi:hypothetical protein
MDRVYVAETCAAKLADCRHKCGALKIYVVLHVLVLWFLYKIITSSGGVLLPMYVLYFIQLPSNKTFVNTDRFMHCKTVFSVAITTCLIKYNMTLEENGE